MKLPFSEILSARQKHLCIIGQRIIYSHFVRPLELMGLNLDPNRVITKDVKSFRTALMPDAQHQQKEYGQIHWLNTGSTQYNAQLGLPDKVPTIVGRVVCNSYVSKPTIKIWLSCLCCYHESRKSILLQSKIKIEDGNVGILI